MREATIVGVADLGQARLADPQIGRHPDVRRLAFAALHDRERRLGPRRETTKPGCLLDPRRGRGLAEQPRGEAIELLRRALDLDHHPAGVVADVTDEPQRPRDRGHEGPQADPLDLPREQAAPALDRHADSSIPVISTPPG